MIRNKIYVDSVGGSDSYSGIITAPFATLAKAMQSLTDSTAVYLKRGSVFNNDPLSLIGLNNVLIDAYGEGNDPIISGLKSITGWTNLGGNIWSHQDAGFSDEVTNVFTNGLRMLIGRYPTTGYRDATGGSNSTLIDTALTQADSHWDECELVIRYYDWATGISRAPAYVNKTFSFPVYYQDEDTGYYYSVKNGTDYFIQNHVNCLSVQNTWAYKPSTQTLYIYSTSEPSNITANFGDDLIYIEDCRHVSIKNIDITAARQCGINVLDSYKITIDGVLFTYSGIYSMLFRNVHGIKLLNSEGYDQNNDFAYMTQCSNVYIDAVTALRCGVDTGACRYMPVFARGQTGGITAQIVDNWCVRHTEVGYVSYGAITASFGNGFVFENNYAHHFNLNKYDGGGICTNTAIRWHLPYRENIYPMSRGRMYKNIVTHGNSAKNSYGMYVDNFSYNFETSYNFVAGARWNFILHESINNNCHHNIMVQENDSDAGVSYGMTYPTSTGAIIDNNTYVNILTTTPSFYSISQETNTPNTITNNKYFYPNGKLGTGGDVSINELGTTWFSLSQWEADESRVNWIRTGETELTPSINTGIIHPYDLFCLYFVNPSQNTRTVTSDEVLYDDYMDTEGTYQTFPFDIPPYEGKVLVRAPKPIFHNAVYDVLNPNVVTVTATVFLNETLVPDVSAFTLPTKTISSVDVVGNKIILTTVEDYEAGDDFSIIYTKPVSNPITALYGELTMDSFSATIENDYTHVVTATGSGSGVSTLRIISRETITLTLDGTAKFYDDVAGTINEGTTRIITGTVGNTISTVYFKCPSGTANLVFSEIDCIVDLRFYGTTNCASLGGSFARYTSLTYLLATGNNTFSFDLSGLHALENIVVYGNNSISGSTENLVKLHTFDVRGNNTITHPSVAKLKRLTNYIVSSPCVLTTANVNQLLADFWANRDDDKYTTQTIRVINLMGGTGTGAPTGQGVIDKANLQNYRSPWNDPAKALWTVTTR